MNELMRVFNYQNKEVRTALENGQPWFVAKDVCEYLELNPSEAVRGRKDRNFEDGIDKEDFRDDIDITDTIGRNQKVLAVNESGLYDLVFKSKKPEAKQFKRWITHEVIPSIRKHGAYMTPETIEKALLDPDTIIQLATTLKQERQFRLIAEQKIEQDKPKVLFADAVSTSKTSILVGELAKLIKQNGCNIGQNILFEWLRENGYLIKREGSDYNMPTQYSMERKLFDIKETSITHSDGHISVHKTSKITGKGQQYFINKFLNK